tara:strand:+ start:40388 stop:41227 length:840 start_codon:yes stop_codon:yes gene_type:complete
MISVIGLGNAASRVAEQFSTTANYNVYLLNSKISRNSKRKFKLKAFENPESYEENIPDVGTFFKDLDDHVQLFIVGSSYSSNYALGILEQIKQKKVELFYVQPDTELLTGIPKMLDKLVFSILQEYARSGLLHSFTALSHLNVERAIGDIPIKKYYDTINSAIFSAVHYCNYFNHAEPEIGSVSKPLDINRIRSIAMLNPKNLQEKWLFDLDNERDICYYICINQDKLETDGSLHRRIVEKLKNKPRNAFRKISYAIYETPHDDFGFCVAHTNAIQNYT